MEESDQEIIRSLSSLPLPRPSAPDLWYRAGMTAGRRQIRLWQSATILSCSVVAAVTLLPNHPSDALRKPFVRSVASVTPARSPGAATDSSARSFATGNAWTSDGPQPRNDTAEFSNGGNFEQMLSAFDQPIHSGERVSNPEDSNEPPANPAQKELKPPASSDAKIVRDRKILTPAAGPVNAERMLPDLDRPIHSGDNKTAE